MSDRKTLLPELLPEPRPQSAETPRERVAVRARAMLDRLSGLKTAAGAALLAAHCGGYGVVDPLPPPPMQCTSNSDPFANLLVSGIAVPADGGWSDAVHPAQQLPLRRLPVRRRAGDRGRDPGRLRGHEPDRRRWRAPTSTSPSVPTARARPSISRSTSAAVARRPPSTTALRSTESVTRSSTSADASVACAQAPATSSMRLPNGSSTWQRVTPGTSVATRTSMPAADRRAIRAA